ncbi:MAG: glycosyltransferase [Gammaproteobacteria bacterium]
MSDVELTLVMCTRNRGAFLPAALEACARMTTARRWELIIVNNGSTDDTATVIADFIAADVIDARTVFEAQPGLARARNAGWRAARGEIVAFTDDDCYPAADYIDELCRCMSERALDYIGGRVLLHDPQDLPVTIQLRDTPLDIAPRSFVPTGLIHGANMGAKREVLERVAGFDELLGAGTPFPSEDVEFLSLASAAGFTGGYDPRPTISHHHRRRTADQVGALRKSYDIGRGAYYMACILDARRRHQALQRWYWSALGNLTDLLRRPGGAVTTAREMRGALGYWRAARRRRSSTPQPPRTNIATP